MTREQFMQFRQIMAEKMGLTEGHGFRARGSPLAERRIAALLGCSRGQVRTWSAKGGPAYLDHACQSIIAKFKSSKKEAA